MSLPSLHFSVSVGEKYHGGRALPWDVCKMQSQFRLNVFHELSFGINLEQFAWDSTDFRWTTIVYCGFELVITVNAYAVVNVDHVHYFSCGCVFERHVYYVLSFVQHC